MDKTSVGSDDVLVIDGIEANGIEYVFHISPPNVTNSDNGVTSLKNVYPVIEQMQKEGLPLLIHGEVTQPEVDIFDREKVFIETVLDSLLKKFPKLKVVLEHITTKDAVDFVSQSKDNVAATITAHHLLSNRNHMFLGGIKPHYYCLPVLKRRVPHQEALIKAAISGSPKFFLGTDSAPHPIEDKSKGLSSKPGIFSAPCSIELYAEIFEQENAINNLEIFSSINGAKFYGFTQNKSNIRLKKTEWIIPEFSEFKNIQVKNFFANKKINWKVIN